MKFVERCPKRRLVITLGRGPRDGSINCLRSRDTGAAALPMLIYLLYCAVAWWYKLSWECRVRRDDGDVWVICMHEGGRNAVPCRFVKSPQLSELWFYLMFWVKWMNKQADSFLRLHSPRKLINEPRTGLGPDLSNLFLVWLLLRWVGATRYLLPCATHKPLWIQLIPSNPRVKLQIRIYSGTGERHTTRSSKLIRFSLTNQPSNRFYLQKETRLIFIN